MLRRLLACLVLISGLTAIGTPAHANIVEAVGTTIEQAERGEKDARRVLPSCVERQREQRARGDKVTPCKPDETVAILVPRVMFGIDRAYE